MCAARTNYERTIGLASYHRRADRFLRLGLSTRGKPYRRTPNLPATVRAAHQRRINLAKYHRRAQRRAAQGLTTRGLVPSGRRKLAVLLQGSPIVAQISHMRRAA
jgi:hypothetical protein